MTWLALATPSLALLLTPLPIGAVPDGSLVRASDTCFVITSGEREIGRTRQQVRAATRGGEAVWDVVIRQRTADGGFDLRDTFVLTRTDLRPILLTSERGTNREDRGWQRVSVIYSSGRIDQRVESAKGVEHKSREAAKPVWDANLWGLTIAALPLETGAKFALPTWHYSNGEGHFEIEVL